MFQIRQAEEKCLQYELTVDRLAREKTSLAADLDEWKNRIQRQEIDLSQVRSSRQPLNCAIIIDIFLN